LTIEFNDPSPLRCVDLARSKSAAEGQQKGTISIWLWTSKVEGPPGSVGLSGRGLWIAPQE
jgi:hypothetical protein